MKQFFWAMLRRLREPSTMAGLSAVAVLVGIPPGTLDVGIQVIAAVAAVAAVALPETTEK